MTESIKISELPQLPGRQGAAQFLVLYNGVNYRVTADVMSPPFGIAAGDGLTGTDVFAVLPDGSTIDVSSSGIKLADLAVVTTKIAANAVTTAKIADEAVTMAKLVDGTAVGQQPFWDGSAWRLIGISTGAALSGTANETLTAAGGTQYLLSVALTASRDKRLSLTGLTVTEKGLMLTIYSIATRAFTMVIKDDAAGTVLFTFPASASPMVATFQLNDAATAWVLAGWSYLGTVV